MAKKESPLYDLAVYLPSGSYEIVARYLITHKVHLTITRERTTMLGKYQAGYGRKNHQISINGNLNPYAFLITLLHELGHLIAFQRYGARIPAHGIQWKREYSRILAYFISRKIFPEDVEKELLDTLENPAATSCAETSLLRILRKYDPYKPGFYLLEELPRDSYFKIKSGQMYRKGEIKRTRFLCKEERSRRLFLFSPVTEVEWVRKRV